jgi:hypothetical protein
VDVKEKDPFLKVLNFIKDARGLTQNTEIIRLLLKEEYNRLRSRELIPADDPLAQQAIKFIKENPEYGYRDLDDIVRVAVRGFLQSQLGTFPNNRKPQG